MNPKPPYRPEIFYRPEISYRSELSYRPELSRRPATCWAYSLLIGAGLVLGGWLPPAQAFEDTAESTQAVGRPAGHDEGLASRLLPLIDAHPGEVAVAVRHLDSGAEFRHRGEQPMPTASLIKLPLLVAAYEAIAAGELGRDEPLVLTDADKVPGSGILTKHFADGASLTLRDALRLMIAFSDNTATNLVVDRVGLSTTASAMERLGLAHTKLHSKVFRRDTSLFPDRSERFGLGSTTAGETVRLLEMIAEAEILTPELCDEILGHLLACEDRDKLARRLPPGISLAHKSGAVNASRCDAGLLIGPAVDGKPVRVAICVLTDRNEDRSWTRENAAERLIASVAEQTCRHFWPEGFADTGDDPTPAASGGEATDQASTPGQGPGEPLNGPPVVSCRAWAVGDGETGRLLSGHRADERLDNASTTKLMTAWLIARVAERDPDILVESVTFSDHAAGTIGSSAGLRAGDSISVGDLLYGLLLPSGNDAAVAFAEHFGSRMRPDSANGGQSSGAGGAANGGQSSGAGDGGSAHDDFVAAMNREAESLGLQGTRFRNPHGLTAEGHHSTAHDLMRLGWRVIRDPLLSGIVATPTYRGTAVDAHGDERVVTWKNTNRLLGLGGHGYSGVKTGTTTAAGACLVAAGSRGGRTRLVVVLGSSGSEARYADARNLFRWSWQQ